ncbi:zinc-dependent alcohol dehydrogenase family protein [Catenulispora subtropica]|uniref:Zinc-dependent alcohol dehydrogenase family protein n=2 Tax=Catenulispora subtropica TaxID=450798 RepID=A0ABN2TB81_9ACTN
MAVHEFGGFENLVPARIEIREPGEGDVLIRVKAAAVNPADLGMRDGRYVWPDPVRMPVVPGYDVAGVVEHGTARFPAGTAVIAYTAHTKTQVGAYAEFVTLPESLVAEAPGSVDWATAGDEDWGRAAALPLAGLTAQSALARLAMVAGERLLVNRVSSAVGRFVEQLAKARGVEVVSLEGEGADAGLVDTRLVDTGFVDAALDVAGAEAALAAFARVKDGGRYATIVPEFWIPGGQFTAARGIEPVTVFVDETVGSLAELSRSAAQGILRPRIAALLPLTDAAEAHRRMAAGGARGKLILVP